ncbi:MAG: NfeD family protein [candidate division Zixibacteria bacterium]|nr:NfeD family protein [candidate division Zixibacteria bacterium]
MSDIFWIWLAVAVIFLIIELVTPTLFFVCFFAGALASGVYSYFSPDQYYWQIGIFVIVSLALLPPTRILAKKLDKPSAQKSNVDALVGKTGRVIKPIGPDSGGQVQIGGEIWIASANSTMAEGVRIQVLSVSGTRLNVEEFTEEGGQDG